MASPRRGTRQRNRDYSAPWRQKCIPQDLMAVLAQQVDEHITDMSAALHSEACPTVKFKHFSKGLSGESAIGQAETTDEALDEFRHRLGVKFGSLIRAFQAMDHNGDGVVTYAELKKGLQSYHMPWTETRVDRDLRAIFRALDPTGEGRLCQQDWVRGTNEDKEAMAAEAARLAAKRPKKSKVVPLDQRPQWSLNLQGTDFLNRALFECHEEHDFLPERPDRPLPNYTLMRPYEHVLQRSEKHLEKKQENIEKGLEHKAKEHARKYTYHPRLLPKSKAIMEGRHVRPWEGKTELQEHTFARRMREDFAEAQEEETGWFKPEINQRSRDLFMQFEDNGQDWHDRMFLRSKEPRSDRMCLAEKKMTKEVHENYFRERTPKVGATSAKMVEKRAKSLDLDVDTHTRLHMGGYRHFENQKAEAARRARAYVRHADESVLAPRPGSQRGASPSRAVPAGADTDVATTVGDDFSPGRTEPSSSETESPTRTMATSLAVSVGSTLKSQDLRASSVSFQESSEPQPLRVAASLDIIQLLSACGPYTRRVGGDEEQKGGEDGEVGEEDGHDAGVERSSGGELVPDEGLDRPRMSQSWSSRLPGDEGFARSNLGSQRSSPGLESRMSKVESGAGDISRVSFDRQQSAKGLDKSRYSNADLNTRNIRSSVQGEPSRRSLQFDAAEDASDARGFFGGGSEEASSETGVSTTGLSFLRGGSSTEAWPEAGVTKAASRTSAVSREASQEAGVTKVASRRSAVSREASQEAGVAKVASRRSVFGAGSPKEGASRQASPAAGVTKVSSHRSASGTGSPKPGASREASPVAKVTKVLSGRSAGSTGAAKEGASRSASPPQEDMSDFPSVDQALSNETVQERKMRLMSLGEAEAY